MFLLQLLQHPQELLLAHVDTPSFSLEAASLVPAVPVRATPPLCCVLRQIRASTWTAASLLALALNTLVAAAAPVICEQHGLLHCIFLLLLWPPGFQHIVVFLNQVSIHAHGFVIVKDEATLPEARRAGNDKWLGKAWGRSGHQLERLL